MKRPAHGAFNGKGVAVAAVLQNSVVEVFA